MKCFRAGLKATIQWCLEQEELFTQRECFTHFDVHQVTVSKQFNKLEQCGILKKYPEHGRTWVYEVADRELAQQKIDQKPIIKGAYIPVAVKKRKRSIVNSVFALGGLC